MERKPDCGREEASGIREKGHGRKPEKGNRERKMN